MRRRLWILVVVLLLDKVPEKGESGQLFFGPICRLKFPMIRA